ncbi:Pre-rRNA-processing protein esf-2 [Diplonema papillatum]|nr:Pre-rRNA-processing protein esf-2 [Diplonema papillatum]
MVVTDSSAKEENTSDVELEDDNSEEGEEYEESEEEDEEREEHPAPTSAEQNVAAPKGVPVKAANRAQGRQAKGVVYLSRIPYGMNPSTLRAMFTPVGPVGRMFLKPKEVRGNKEQKKKQRQRRLFSEGWVEFSEKKHAKRCALMNCTPVGGNRRSTYAEELWNIKYLPSFTWEDLQEEVILKKQYLRREVTRIQKEGLKVAEDYRKVAASHPSKHSRKPAATGHGKREGGVKRFSEAPDSSAPAAKRRNVVMV